MPNNPTDGDGDGDGDADADGDVGTRDDTNRSPPQSPAARAGAQAREQAGDEDPETDAELEARQREERREVIEAYDELREQPTEDLRAEWGEDYDPSFEKVADDAADSAAATDPTDAADPAGPAAAETGPPFPTTPSTSMSDSEPDPEPDPEIDPSPMSDSGADEHTKRGNGGPPDSLEQAASESDRRQQRADQFRGGGDTADRGGGNDTPAADNASHTSGDDTEEYDNLTDEEVLQQVYEDATRTKPYHFPTKYREIYAEIEKVSQERSFDFLRALLEFQSERSANRSDQPGGGDRTEDLALADVDPEDLMDEDGSFSLDELDEEAREDIADAAATAGPQDIPSGKFVAACKDMLAAAIVVPDDADLNANMFKYLIRETSEVPVRKLVEGAIQVLEFSAEADLDDSFR
jgi:hypothetical protein